MASAAPVETKPATPVIPPVVEEPKPIMAAVKLRRHYRPRGEFEVTGWWRPEVRGKDPKDGPKASEKVLVPAAFMEELEEDESNPNYGKIKGAPPPLAGVGTQSTKLWASTVVRLPKDEARRVVKEGIGDAEIE